MNNPSSSGLKLTTVILAVIIMALSAILSGNSVAENIDAEITQTEE